MSGSLLIRPPPTAHGSLETAPLVNLLVYMSGKKLDGTLELKSPDGASAPASIFFVAGQPAKVKTSEPGHYLGGILADLGYVEGDQLTASLGTLASAKARGPALHGQVLLQAGVIDRGKLEAGLREQISRKLRQISSMPPATSYEYFAEYDALRDWGAEAHRGFDPLPMLWPMLLESPPSKQVAEILARVASSVLRISRTPELERLRLGPDERATVELLRVRPLRTEDLVAASGMRPREAHLLVYLLMVTRQVEVRRPSEAVAQPEAESERPTRPISRPDAAAPPASSPLVPPAVPRAVSGERSAPAPDLDAQLSRRAREILDCVDALEATDHFEMLGVARDATRDQIETAFFRLARKWHPDALPRALASLRLPCSRVFARIGEAHAVLADDAQRARYRESLTNGEDSREDQELVERVLDAVTYFQKAEICLKLGDNAEAEDLCARAVKGDPSQAEYHALLAWVLALKPENLVPARTREQIRILDRALAMNERCEKAYFWRGLLYKRLGEVHAAVRDFRHAADLNPDNIDAVREVRLHNMRGESRKSSGVHATGKKPASSPLLDRIRKK